MVDGCRSRIAVILCFTLDKSNNNTHLLKASAAFDNLEVYQHAPPQGQCSIRQPGSLPTRTSSRPVQHSTTWKSTNTHLLKASAAFDNLEVYQHAPPQGQCSIRQPGSIPTRTSSRPVQHSTTWKSTITLLSKFGYLCIVVWHACGTIQLAIRKVIDIQFPVPPPIQGQAVHILPCTWKTSTKPTVLICHGEGVPRSPADCSSTLLKLGCAVTVLLVQVFNLA